MPTNESQNGVIIWQIIYASTEIVGPFKPFYILIIFK
jgi:hypothetical protein